MQKLGMSIKKLTMAGRHQAMNLADFYRILEKCIYNI